ncbi:MAG: helix-turn-helix transcriptional regulator [Clostridia bacterium]|nr:helix-turn-helix transcriptional regulator [Clostridia bacterium]
MKKTTFAHIYPYVRYARQMRVGKNTPLSPTVPCDNRLFYTLEGVGRLEADGTSYEMTKGDLILFSAGTKYRICPAEESVTYLILNFDYTSEHSSITTPIPPKSINAFRENDIIEEIFFDDIPELSLPVYLRKRLDVLDKMLEIEKEYSRKILHFETKISNVLSEILIDCVREIKLQTVSDGYEIIDEILQFIHDNYDKKLTNVLLGKKFSFHPNYISYLIKRYTGKPLHKYILNVKISHAIALLDEGRLSIGEISNHCGFCDIYYFSRLFKQYMGISPLEYRGKKNIK